MQRIFPPGKFTYPADDQAAEKRLPLGNVFILSIEDFELAMSCVKQGLVNLSELVKQAADLNRKAESSRLFFADFLRGHTNICGLPQLIREARDTSDARLKAVLEAD